jgi:4-diphosphocytidyl-2-C-methyl-D-erythritol kinase
MHAYAKINLGLFIHEKRPDGFHTIETVFHPIDLYDEITFSPAKQIEMVSSSSDVPANETNLCHRAATLVHRLLGRNDGVRIMLKKNIPVGAGLGGGSSDAAFVLLHLPDFWGTPLPSETLQEFAQQLGSDVSYFLRTGTALAKGRGEILEYFPLEVPFTILVCYPNIHISTAWAYRTITPRRMPSQPDLKELILSGMKEPLRLVNGLRNEFEPVVFAHHPEIMRVKEMMMRSGACFASLSGSGSSVFAFFEDSARAATLRAHCEEKGYRAFLTQPGFRPTH